MSVGFVLLVHEALDRSEQLARHLADRGCPVVIHLDNRLGADKISQFQNTFEDEALISFVPIRRCEWGTWSLVSATLDATASLLDQHQDIRYVYLASGSCLPLRPIGELVEFLERHADTDFIESVTVEDVDWTVGGLDRERFSLWFPFGWKSNRRAFDATVELQRFFRVSRHIPGDLTPHLGSQWWCLTRKTLEKILNDPDRDRYTKFFKTTWIPDESFFQTLVRKHSSHISSRSLTLSKFDHRGKPHVFYDDHLPLLRRSDCFFARKVWRKADKLYRSFLSDLSLPKNMAEPTPGVIDRVFLSASHRRRYGRDGLYMAGRHPRDNALVAVSAAPYWVFQGVETVFPGFSSWFSSFSGAQVHGHLFAPDRVEFADSQSMTSGSLTDLPTLRDYRPGQFLTNLIWNTRGERQAFHFGPGDRQAVTKTIKRDDHANVFIISGAWSIDLFERHKLGEDVRKRAADLQRIEAAHLTLLRDRWCRARVRIWSLSDVAHDPNLIFKEIFDSVSGVSEAGPIPQMADLEGLADFLQSLRDSGMNPHLTGDFTADLEMPRQPDAAIRPYLVT
ncbi:MAG: glycosyl transferase [Rhodobacteraceae bacterium]|nr:glycosyl transferase [Paracoccaceae bacterium]